MHLTSLIEYQSLAQPALDALRTLTLLAHTLTISQEASVIAFLSSHQKQEKHEHFVDVIEHKNKNTISKNTLAALQTVGYQLFTLMIAWLAGSCGL